MKIYLAGASSERDIVRFYRDKLIAAGHEIIHDWVAAVDANVAAGKTDRDLTPDEALEHATADSDAAYTADVFWLLIPANPKSSIGCWFELGTAIQGYATTILSGDTRCSIFCEMANERYASHEEGFAAVLAVRFCDCGITTPGNDGCRAHPTTRAE